MGPSQPSLPIEIIDHIFKGLYSSDFEGLKNCSSVCRLFLRLSRLYLFRTVSITLREDGINATPDPSSSSPYATFLSFLASDAHLASNIRKLLIQNARSSSSLQERRWRKTASLLADLRPKLTSVSQLSLHSAYIYDWTLEDDDLRVVLVDLWKLATIQDLQLHYITLSRKDLLDLVRIPKLTLFGVRVIQAYPPVSPAGNSNADTVVLRNLCVVLRNPEVAAGVYDIVLAASKALQSLKWLASPYHNAQDMCLSIIDLQTFSSLTSLSLTHPLDGDRPLLDLARLFTRNTGESSLKVVEILCDYATDSEESSLLTASSIWQTLDQTFVSTAYSALEKIVIGVKEQKGVGQSSRTSSGWKDICLQQTLSLFQRNLSLCHSKGLVVSNTEMAGAKTTEN
ncbi:hypothetical protein BDN70DRAFT_140151 [Pholiota conissans]|uniref:F-box domain-containing protein n=1 Tax=Pholiota conissans TaxID=109636 RepID=A0A9P5YZI5_9AGAR|nr:hypothetical protein BDN70DRAFT_140151 [Pholiota conissans]